MSSPTLLTIIMVVVVITVIALVGRGLQVLLKKGGATTDLVSAVEVYVLRRLNISDTDLNAMVNAWRAGKGLPEVVTWIELSPEELRQLLERYGGKIRK